MKTLLTRIAFVAFTAAIGQLALAQKQPSPVQGTLVIPDTKLLPGVPFDMWVELRNSSDATVTVALNPHLLVRPEAGEPFEAKSSGFTELLPAPNHGAMAETYVTLRPGQTQTLTAPVLDDLNGPPFFADPRLSPPGRYTIQMRLDSFAGEGLGERPPLTFAGPVLTNEVTIDRVEPTGADAKVWQRMQASSNSQWVSIQWATRALPLVNDILSNYPESNYVPYALLAQSFGSNDERYLNLVLGAIKQFPNSPVTELLHLTAWQKLDRFSVSKGSLRSLELAKVQQSKRPTTRIRAFGREDVHEPPACASMDDCEDEP